MNGKAGGEESSSIDSPHDFQMPSQAQQNLEGTADNEFDTTNNFDDFLPNQDTFSHRFHNKKLKKDLKALNKKEHREKLQDLLKAIVLCHHATKREETDTESKSLYKSIHSEEESHLMLAHTFDYNFL